MTARVTIAALSVALAGSRLLAGGAPQSHPPTPAPNPTFTSQVEDSLRRTLP